MSIYAPYVCVMLIYAIHAYVIIYMHATQSCAVTCTVRATCNIHTVLYNWPNETIGKEHKNNVPSPKKK